ncbi:MAG TPA: transcription termination/antitermination NusG family protein [Afifellaceae bacterium]|nr:transcription termination/antitermination NusG family protein [Afifellaceae bacterium]
MGRVEGGERWYVVHTLPHREVVAASQLEAQGFRSFLPLRWKTVRHARRFRTVKAPFFPRYLFVALDLGRDRWRAVNGTVGVSQMIMSGDYPAPAPRGLVEDLAVLAAADGVLEFQKRLRPGDKVRLVSGPFADLVGQLQTIDENGRVKILLEVMGGRIPVWSQAPLLAPAA